MHLRSFVLALATVSLSAVAFGQPGAIPAPINPGVLLDAYQLNYLSGLLPPGQAILGDINITNAGQLGADAFGPASGTTGRICVNVYVFAADEELSECCSCLVTPNALVHMTAADLTSNPGNGITPTNGVVIKLLATIPTGAANPGGTNAGPFNGSTCNAASNFTTANLAPGMRAWAVKFHSLGTSPPTNQITETSFLPANLSGPTLPSPPGNLGEIGKLTQLCQFLNGNQSGAGVCPNKANFANGCTLGGLAGSKK